MLSTLQLQQLSCSSFLFPSRITRRRTRRANGVTIRASTTTTNDDNSDLSVSESSSSSLLSPLNIARALAAEGKAPRIFFATRPVVLMLSSVLRSKKFFILLKKKKKKKKLFRLSSCGSDAGFSVFLRWKCWSMEHTFFASSDSSCHPQNLKTSGQDWWQPWRDSQLMIVS